MIKITLFIVLITIAFIIFIFSGLGINEERVQQLESQNNGLSSEALFVIPLAYASSNNDDEDDEDEKRYDKKGKYINNWDGSKLTYDEMVERNQKCLEMERKGYLLNVNCTSFPLTQEGEKIIVDYIVQTAIKGYYQPKN
jgi:hypothetical protein